MNRLMQIARCMDELALCRRDARPGYWGAVIGECDWLEELHTLLYQ